MRVGLFLLAALLLFVLGVIPDKQSPTLLVSQQVMSLKSMDSTKASAATDIKIRPLREDKSNFYPWCKYFSKVPNFDESTKKK